MTLSERGVMGSLVVDGHAVRMVDLFELAEVAHPDWVSTARQHAGDQGGPTILLAEDSDFFRTHVAGYLEEHGYHASGNHWRVNDSLRALVSFERLNLLGPHGHRGRFDVIFCRNVAIYFTPDARRDLFLRLTQSLAPEGYLFVGSSESLCDLGPQFHPLHHCRTVYYQPNKPPSSARSNGAGRVAATPAQAPEARNAGQIAATPLQPVTSG